MISPYRRYTATEIDAANGADLPDLLASLGYQVRRVGSCYTTKEMDRESSHHHFQTQADTVQFAALSKFPTFILH